MELDHNTRIRAQNDAFRQCPEMAIPFGIDGTIVTTRGVTDLFREKLDIVMRRVRTYSAFSEDSYKNHNMALSDHHSASQEALGLSAG